MGEIRMLGKKKKIELSNQINFAEAWRIIKDAARNRNHSHNIKEVENKIAVIQAYLLRNGILK